MVEPQETVGDGKRTACKRPVRKRPLTIAEEIAKCKFVVRLTQKERGALHAIVAEGRQAACKRALSVRKHASVLLYANADGPNWCDPRIAGLLRVGLSTVHRIREAFVAGGLDAAVYRKKPTGRQYRKLDGAGETRLIALASGPPPAGCGRWTLQLLADRLVELRIVESITHECVRQALKRRTSPASQEAAGASTKLASRLIVCVAAVEGRTGPSAQT
jgi:hypothetical protein